MLVQRVLNHHKSLVVALWKRRGDPDYRIEVRRSLRKLIEVRDNDGPIQVHGSAMGKIR